MLSLFGERTNQIQRWLITSIDLILVFVLFVKTKCLFISWVMIQDFITFSKRAIFTVHNSSCEKKTVFLQGACMAVGRAWLREGVCVHGWRDGYCSGRYASYWNAFLLLCKSIKIENSLTSRREQLEV